jgi:hypothetical protein
MIGAARASRAIAAAAACSCVLAFAQSSAELDALIAAGKPEAAYQLARKSLERLGQPEFDLSFGIAAVHSGHAAEGVLALERFMLLNPRHEAARLELARGYFLLGDDARAREEFELAARNQPSPAASQVIAEHLEALRQREARYKRTFAAHVELGGGYDSNPRAGVDSPLITLPVLGEVTVVESGVRQADTTWNASIGARASVPFTARVAAFAAAQADVVRYPDTRDFDQDIYAGSIGISGQQGRHGWRAGASRGYQTLNRMAYRQTYGLFGDWGTSIDGRTSVSLGLQAGYFEYAGPNSVRDSDFQSAIVGVRRFIAHAWRPQVDLSLNAGREQNEHDDRQDLSRNMYGARVGLTLAPLPGWTVGAAALYQLSRYREPDAVLLTTREDRYAAAELVISWFLTRSLSLRVELSSSRNDSNLALYEYRRNAALIKGRYELR